MRFLLFVSADGGNKLDRAMASGADAVIVDLEDSIAPIPQGSITTGSRLGNDDDQ